MSITLAQAKALSPGDYVHSPTIKNADGTPTRWRVTGRVKTWKRSPDRIRVPLKHGMYDYDSLDETDLDRVCLGYGS